MDNYQKLPTHIQHSVKVALARHKPINLSKCIIRAASRLPRGKERDAFLTQFTIVPSKELLKVAKLEITLTPKKKRSVK